jgi:amidase
MPDMDAVLRLGALEQAAAIASGRLDAEELVEAYLARIRRLDGALSAFVHVDEAGARRAARDKDRFRRGSLPPFHGLPIGIKDLNLAAGMFARFGSRAFERFFAFSDDATVKQLRAAGFVMVGKTATSELGTLPVSEPDIHPPARNPWNGEHTPGGSSGGSAAAVAAGLVPVAQASDGAGSIRIPASFCGLYGLKPSRGRVPNPFGADDRRLIYTMGAVTRTVADGAAMLDVMAGITVGKPHWAPPPPKPFLSMIDEPIPSLKILVVTDTPLAVVAPEVREATLRFARTLERAGHRIVDGAMVDGAVDDFLPVWQHTTAHAPVHDWNLTQPTTRWLAAKGRGHTLAQIHALVESLERRVLAWFDGWDLAILPTVPNPAPKVGAWKGLRPPEVFARAVEIGPFTAPFNVSGQPAASVPAGLSSSGLPIGVQLVGRPNDDALVLAVSRLLERAHPWRDAIAPMWSVPERAWADA